MSVFAPFKGRRSFRSRETHFTERQRTRSFSGCIPSTPTERIESKEFGWFGKNLPFGMFFLVKRVFC